MRRVYSFFALLISTGIFVAAMPSTLRAQSPGGGGDRVQAQWSTFAKMPVAKINHAATGVGGAIFVLGGTTGIDPSNDMYVYDIGTDTWSRSVPCPLTRNLGTAETVNGKVYFLGGYSTLSPIFRLTNPVSEFDPVSNQWNERASIPTPVAGATSFVVDNKIYLLGGSASGGLNTDYKDLVQVYDPATNTWEAATPYPAAGRGMMATAIGNTVYVVGGYNNKVAPAVKKDVYKGEVSGTTITWTKVKDYPESGLQRGSIGADGNKVFVCGGQTNTAIVAKTWAYDPATDTWEAMSDKTTGMHSASKMIYDGTGMLYVFGGTTSSGQSDATEALQTKTSPLFNVDVKAITSTFQSGKSKRFTVAISNKGSGSCTWSATATGDGASGITLIPASGTLMPENSANVLVKIVGTNAGTYNANIEFASNDPVHPLFTVPVTYTVTTDPISVGKRVFLEEFTGTWCGWCPYGVDSIHSIMKRYPDNLVVASYHNGDAMAFLKRTEENFLHVAYFPGAVVDRTYFPGESDTMVDRGSWGKYIEQQAAKSSPVEVYFSNKQMNPVSKLTTVTVNIRFLEDVPAPLRVNLLQMESGQNYAHKLFGNPSQTVIDPYFHEHVVKQLLPDIYGEVVLDAAPATSGQIISKNFTFTSMDSVADNSELVAFVHRGTAAGTGEVLQVTADYLTDNMVTAIDAPLSTSFALLENYPNPFNPSTTIRYSIPTAMHVTLLVTDAMGREVARLVGGELAAGTYTATWNSDGLSSGTYIARLIAGNTVIARSMTLLK